jgi:hypothetical protein
LFLLVRSKVWNVLCGTGWYPMGQNRECGLPASISQPNTDWNTVTSQFTGS